METVAATKSTIGRNFRQQSNFNFFCWFALVNVGVIATISIWTDGDGLVLTPFVLLLGLGGALVTLWLSRWLAVRAHSIVFVDSDERHEYSWLADSVADIAVMADLKAVPQIGIWQSSDANAFATGSSPSKSIVAFSTALLDRLSPDEVRAVAAHEIAHIANRDMLGMTVLQGVVNAFVLTIVLPINLFRFANLYSGGRGTWSVEIVARILKFLMVMFITFLGSLGVKAFSRKREFRADAMAAKLISREHMKSALMRLSETSDSDMIVPEEQKQFACFKINGRGFMELFSTHPSIEKRIRALEERSYAT